MKLLSMNIIFFSILFWTISLHRRWDDAYPLETALSKCRFVLFPLSQTMARKEKKQKNPWKWLLLTVCLWDWLDACVLFFSFVRNTLVAKHVLIPSFQRNKHWFLANRLSLCDAERCDSLEFLHSFGQFNALWILQIIYH